MGITALLTSENDSQEFGTYRLYATILSGVFKTNQNIYIYHYHIRYCKHKGNDGYDNA